MTAGRSLTGLLHSKNIIRFCNVNSAQRLTRIRSLTLSSRLSAKAGDDSKGKDEPIKFSTSKASHKTWKVDGSLGSQFERPWWKVLPLSLFGIGLVFWCALRGETDIDRNLYEDIFVSSEENEEED